MSAGGYGYGGLGGGEVVTIQLGRSSNFVGSHFWNIQVSCGIVFCFDVVEIVDERLLKLWL